MEYRRGRHPNFHPDYIYGFGNEVDDPMDEEYTSSDTETSSESDEDPILKEELEELSSEEEEIEVNLLLCMQVLQLPVLIPVILSKFTFVFRCWCLFAFCCTVKFKFSLHSEI
jgi:hypothetical protein